MYKKGTAIELQFSSARLNDTAGDPYWIDLDTTEAHALLAQLERHLAVERSDTAAPCVISLDPEASASAAEPASVSAVAASAAVPDADADSAFKQWVCVICGWIYDEAAGVPEEGIAPGTRWAEVPDDWRCPLCDVGKEDFALVEF